MQVRRVPEAALSATVQAITMTAAVNAPANDILTIRGRKHPVPVTPARAARFTTNDPNAVRPRQAVMRRPRLTI